jgi:hypothetical protein
VKRRAAVCCQEAAVPVPSAARAEKTAEELEAEAKKVEIVDSTVMRVVFKNQEISEAQLVKEVRRQVPKSRAILSVSDVEAGMERLLTSEYMTKDGDRGMYIYNDTW